MDSFVYKWTNTTLNKIYIGFHKGCDDDGYICSSSSSTFWNDFHNESYVWKREILFRGSMKECQILESKLLDEINIKSDSIYNNRNNLMFNLNEEVIDKLKKYASSRTPQHLKKLSEATKKQWENPAHREYMSSINKGKKHTEESKEKIRIARSKQIITKESIKKAADSNRGKKRSEEFKKRLSEISKNRPKVMCPHCGKVGIKNSMLRWHFNNCKLYNNENI